MKFHLAICMCALVLLGAYRPQVRSREQEQVFQLVHKKAPDVNWDHASLLKGNFNPDGKSDYAVLGQEGESKVFVAVVYSPVEPNAPVDILGFGVGQDEGSLCNSQRSSSWSLLTMLLPMKWAKFRDSGVPGRSWV